MNDSVGAHSKARRDFVFRERITMSKSNIFSPRLLEQDDTDLHKICRHYEVNIDRLSKDVTTRSTV